MYIIIQEHHLYAYHHEHKLSYIHIIMYVYYCIIYVYSHLCISSCMYHISSITYYTSLYITCDTPMTLMTVTLLWELTSHRSSMSHRHGRLEDSRQDAVHANAWAALDQWGWRT